jgi:catechol 2,3-dioxygenase-like lactoylglutathione lyase family enzyme
MTVHLDHVIVSSHNALASAKLLGELLGVPWAASGMGPFSPVYINEGLTFDFIETEEAFPVEHFCFRVSQEEFDAILQRIKTAGIKYRSTVRGPDDGKIDAIYGTVYWNEPDGHQ